MTMVNEFGNSNVHSDSLKSNGSFYNRKINAKLNKPVSGQGVLLNGTFIGSIGNFPKMPKALPQGQMIP